MALGRSTLLILTIVFIMRVLMTAEARQLQQDDGIIYTTTDDLTKVVKSFFETLYTSTTDIEFWLHPSEDHCALFLTYEVRSVLMQMNISKMPRNDHITIKMLKLSHETLVPLLT